MAKGTLKYLPLNNLAVTKDNCRTINTQDPAFCELVTSISKQGILEPLLVRPNAKAGKYEVRAGARRLAAARAAGLKEVPCIEYEFSDQEAAEATLAENLHRENLTPLEEAANIQACLDKGWSADSIAANLAKPPYWILRRARLLKLSPKWSMMASDPKFPVFHWPASHLEIIARLDEDVQNLILKEESDRRWNSCLLADVSIRDLEETVQRYTRELGKAPWRLDENIGDRACLGCPQRSSARPGLFDEINLDDKKEARRDRCLGPKCWEKKLQIHAKAKLKELETTHGDVILMRDSNSSQKPVLPDPQNKAKSSWEVHKAKQTDKGAKPVMNIHTGEISWGKIEKHQEDQRKKAQKSDEPVEQGDPALRAEVAREFAMAQLAYTIGYDREGSRWLATGNPTGRICAAVCCLLDNGGYGGPADAWLCAKLRMFAVLQNRPDDLMMTHFYNNQISEHRELLDFMKDQFVPTTDHGTMQDSLIDKCLTLGLFHYLSGLGVKAKPWFEIGEKYWEMAAQRFVIPRMFLHKHRKGDLLVIAKSLNVKVSSNAKVDQVVDTIMKANLPAGTLTPELRTAFAPRVESLDEIRKKIKKIKKAR